MIQESRDRYDFLMMDIGADSDIINLYAAIIQSLLVAERVFALSWQVRSAL